MNAFKENIGSEPRYKLRIQPPKYFIHPHNKTVVCVLKCGLPDLPFIPKIAKRHFDYKFLQQDIDFTVKAVVKCRPGDDYNEEIGMKIAESKAMVKAYDKARRILEDYKDIIGKEWDKANTSVDFFEVTLGRECMHLESLTR